MKKRLCCSKKKAYIYYFPTIVVTTHKLIPWWPLDGMSALRPVGVVEDDEGVGEGVDDDGFVCDDGKGCEAGVEVL